VLFVDIRGFTALSEEKLAYDIVHILKPFLRGRPTRRSRRLEGGIDKFIGDGLMALFADPARPGLRLSRRDGAATAIERALVAVNRDLAPSSGRRCASPWGCTPAAWWSAASVPGGAARTVIGPAVTSRAGWRRSPRPAMRRRRFAPHGRSAPPST